MDRKILLGLAIIALCGSTIADQCFPGSGRCSDAVPSKQVTKEGPTGQYKGTVDCGLDIADSGYVPHGCVTFTPILTTGLCNVETSPSYKTWCTDCKLIPGKVGNYDFDTHYATGGSISGGTDGPAVGQDCEFDPDHCTDATLGTCFTGAVSDCLRNTDKDFDFTSVNLMNHCCEEPACPTVPSGEDPATSGCWTCVNAVGTGCPVHTFNPGNECRPDSNNMCNVGTCKEVGGVATCADVGPKVCDDGNDCTEDPACDAATGCAEPVQKPSGSACSNGKQCEQDCTCDAAGVCQGCEPVNCPESYTCNPTTGVCDANQADLAPFIVVGAGGVILLAGAAALVAKKRNSVAAAEEFKRDSVMTQKTDNLGRAAMGMGGADARKSGMSQVSKFTRSPARGGAGSAGAVDFDQVSHATRKSDAISHGSRKSQVTNATRSSQGSAGRRSMGSAGRREPSSGVRSSGSNKSRNSQATRSSNGSRGRQSSGSRGRQSNGSRGRH